jgi:hypothetical protein
MARQQEFVTKTEFKAYQKLAERNVKQALRALKNAFKTKTTKTTTKKTARKSTKELV